MKNRSLWTLVILSVIWGMGIAQGTERFVSSTNGHDLEGRNDCRDQARPCKTIRQALGQAAKGDIIKVLPGSYEECKLEVGKQVKIVSEGVRAIIGPDPNKRAIDEDKEDPLCPKSSLFVLKISGDATKGTRIERISLRGKFTTEGVALLVVEDTSEVVIKENLFRIMGAGAGLKFYNSSFQEITDNEIHGMPGTQEIIPTQGIILDQLQQGARIGSLKIKGNKIFGHGQQGITVQNSDLGTSRLHLLGNVLESNGGHGISVNQVSGLIIEANYVTNNKNNGIELFCKDSPCKQITLKDNIIVGNRGVGINFNGSGEEVQYEEVTVSGNMMQRNDQQGLSFIKGKYSAKIDNNRLESNKQGVTIAGLKDDSSLEVTNNNVSGHQGGDKLRGDGLKITLTGSTKLTVSGNITNQNAGSGLVLEDATEGSEVRIERLISEGNKEGIVLKNSQKVTVQNGQFNSNKCAGLILDNSSDNTISNNTLASNGHSCPPDRFQVEGAGVILKGSSNLNTLKKNNLSYNLNGFSLRLSQSEGNDFVCNEIYKSDHSGILVLPEAGVTTLPDSFKNNNIVGNISFGLRNFTNIIVNAQQNWWGDKSGPRHETNPNGKGDRILGPADFSNWLDKPVDINRCP